MMWSFSLAILFSLSSFAGLEKLEIKNLDFNYVHPYGKGEFEKLNFGVSLKNGTYSGEVFWHEDSYEVQSPFMNFEWLDPIVFFHNLKSLSTEKLNLVLGKSSHELKGTNLKFTEQMGKELSFEKFEIQCLGQSTQKELIDRLRADCREKMQATIDHMVLPSDVFAAVADQLPEIPAEPDQNMPAHDFYLDMNNGDFYSFIRIKYVVKAYLKFWGRVEFENEGKTIAIKVNSIKYGVLPVTSLVFGELARRLQDPRVEITPPWIRIKLGAK